MKEVTRYQCDICGCVYDSEMMAKTCEVSHGEPIGVWLPTEFKRPLDELYGFPRNIVVMFTNGKYARYVYCRPCTKEGKELESNER